MLKVRAGHSKAVTHRWGLAPPQPPFRISDHLPSQPSSYTSTHIHSTNITECLSQAICCVWCFRFYSVQDPPNYQSTHPVNHLSTHPPAHSTFSIHPLSPSSRRLTHPNHFLEYQLSATACAGAEDTVMMKTQSQEAHKLNLGRQRGTGIISQGDKRVRGD